MAQRGEPPAGDVIAVRVLRRAAVFAAVLAAAGVLAWVLGDDLATEVLEVPEPGGVAAERLSDGTPVLVVRDADGEARVFDAREPGARGVGSLVGACPDQPVLTTASPGRAAWTREGRPIHRAGDAAPFESASEPLPPLARYEVDGPVSGGVIGVGERTAPGDAEPAPATRALLRCAPGTEVIAHESPDAPLSFAEVADADDGRYAVAAALEQRGRSGARLCPLPERELPERGGFADQRGALPLCDDGSIDLGDRPVGGGRAAFDPHLLVAWVGRLEVAVEDAAIAEVAVPVGAEWLAEPTGGEVVVRGELDFSDHPAEILGIVTWPPPEADVQRPPNVQDVVLRDAAVVEAPAGAPESRWRPGQSTPLWLADDAEIALPGDASVGLTELQRAVADGDVEGVAYEATIDRSTGETVRLVPVGGDS